MIGIGIGVKQQKVGGYGLAAPIATAATGIGQTSFTANWNAYPGAVVYLLDVSTSPTFDTFIYENQQVNAPTTSYVVIGLNPNTTYYYRVRASTESLTDPDAQAFFDRVTTAGGSLSLTEKSAVNQLVLDMKDDGIWAKMKAIYPMVGASAAACSQNLKSSSFTGTFTATGWTFASTGVTPNGTSAYFDTLLIPDTDLTLNSVSFSVYSRTNYTPSNTQAYGVARNDNYLPLIGGNFLTTKGISNFAYSYAAGEVLTSATNQNLAAMFLTTRTSSTSAKVFRNTTTIASSSSQSQTTQPILSFVFGALKTPTGGFQQYSTFELAFSHIGDGLTDTEASDFYTAVQAFQTTLNRQVS